MEANNVSYPLTGASGKTYYNSEKFTEWCRLFLDKSNKATFGNATRSALLAYQLDEHNFTDYNSAARIGTKNYKKVQDLALIYLNKKGITFGFILDVIVTKVITSNSPVWVMMLANLMGMTNINPKMTYVEQQNNDYHEYTITDQELTGLIETAGIKDMNTEQLMEVLINGNTSDDDLQ